MKDRILAACNPALQNSPWALLRMKLWRVRPRNVCGPVLWLGFIPAYNAALGLPVFGESFFKTQGSFSPVRWMF